MKKSRLKYILIAFLLWSIFGLYQWNKKFFESTDYSGRKKSLAASANSFSSGGASGFNGGFGAGFSSGESVDSDNSISVPSNNSVAPSGFQSSSFSNSSTSDNTPTEEYQPAENLVPEVASNSSGGGGTNSAPGYGGGIALGIPLLSVAEKEEEKDREKKEVVSNISTNRTAGQKQFFNGNLETPMAPLPPNEDIPLDGGASIILILGSMLGVKKLLAGKKANT